jgi:hypothetical protein
MKWLLVLALVACGKPAPSADDVRRARLVAIREVAAQMGVTNAALLAGIAQSETQLAHCWREATYACQGPASADCDDGPVIAGRADGPCAAQQGGLGLFQFDAGTYAQTLAAYGDGVLTVDGSVGKAVHFVIGKLMTDVPGVTDWDSAVTWLNAVPMDPAAPRMQQWAAMLACRYNGCCAKTAACATRASSYRDNAIAMFRAQGDAFWHTAGRCRALPTGGVIDNRSACYVAAGDPQFWRRDRRGFGDGLEWTFTTDAASPSNTGEWRIVTAAKGRFRVEVYVEPGAATSTTAEYSVVHAGRVDNLVIDQARGRGWVPLGTFAFAGTGDEHVSLGDNTGEPADAHRRLVFDALRVTPARDD